MDRARVPGAERQVILFDTHALIWMVEGDDRLGGEARTLADAHRAGDGALVSPISAWEAAMLTRKGKLALSRPVRDWFDAVLSAPGFHLAELSTTIGDDAGSLGDAIHGDPADRMLIATARALGCPLLTADRKILAYARAGHLRAIDARH